MNKLVYAVYWAELDDIFQSELDNIFPTAESAIKSAKEIAKQRNIYEVQVELMEVTIHGMRSVRRLYREVHEERLDY